MFSKLLEGQSKLAHDIADIKSFQQTVACRFDALESRVNELECPPKPIEHGSVSELRAEINCLTSKINELILKNDDLENRSRRNNLIMHGISEDSNENTSTLLCSVTSVFTNTLKITCPQIERVHRLGKARTGYTRPIILKLSNFGEKSVVLKNSSKLKGSNVFITEDFSSRIRHIRKKIWEASLPFRNEGSVVKLSYDDAFIDKVRYNWDTMSNALVKVPEQPFGSRSSFATSSNPTSSCIYLAESVDLGAPGELMILLT